MKSDSFLYPAISTDTYTVRLIHPVSPNFEEDEISMWDHPQRYVDIVRELQRSDDTQTGEMWEVLWRNSMYFPHFYLFNIPPPVVIFKELSFPRATSVRPWDELVLTGHDYVTMEDYHEALSLQFGKAYSDVFSKPSELYPFLTGKRKRTLMYRRMVRYINNRLFVTDDDQVQ